MRHEKITRPPLIIPAPFLAICGDDGTTAALLSYLYRQCLDGPTAIPYADIVKGVHLRHNAINRARGILKDLGYVSEERLGCPPQIYYELDYDRIHSVIDLWVENDD